MACRPLLVLALAAAPAAAQTPTDIVVFDLYPHRDHVHVGSMLEVTDREGYDNQPWFLDHDHLLFTSIREDGQADTYRFSIPDRELVRVTHTPESEYSPRPVPGGGAFTVVRVEMDGVSQHLYRYAMDGTGAERLLPGLADIGYYARAGEDRVALFRLGDPPTLHLANVRTGEARLVHEGVGASVQPIPGTNEVGFVDRSDPEAPWLMRLDPATGEVLRVAELPPGNLEHAWLSDVTALMGHEGVLYRSTGNPERPWHPIVDLGHFVGSFTRIAVSPSGLRIAVVREREEGAPP